jgi:hypothetical protein
MKMDYKMLNKYVYMIVNIYSSYDQLLLIELLIEYITIILLI